MSYTARFTNPTYNYTGGGSGLQTTVPVERLASNYEFDTVSAITIYIRTEVLTKYDLETDDANNPCQTNSTLLFQKDGAIWFRGYVVAKPLKRLFKDGAFLEVICWGWEGILTNALCPGPNGEDVWLMETDSELASLLTLRPSSVYGNFQGDTLWPDPTDVDMKKAYNGNGPFAITAVNVGTEVFSVVENCATEMYPGLEFKVIDSTGNNGTWTVSTRTWTGSQTNITVVEDITDATVDGFIYAQMNMDSLQVAIGIGSYIITGVDQVFDVFVVADNVAAEFTDGTKFEVTGSDGGANDTVYRCDGNALWTGSQTNIAVTTEIPDPTVSGNVISSTIILSSFNQGIKPRGWIWIVDTTNEFVYYDGYTDADDDGYYRIYNCERGELGTTASAHVAGIHAYEKIAKQIAPGSIKLENDPAGGDVEWSPLRNSKEFATLAQLGCFVLPGDADGNYRVTYMLYDEDRILGGETNYILTVEAVIEQLVTGDADYLGAGFVSGDCDFDVINMRINRYEYDPAENPEYVFDAIQDLLATIGFEDIIKFWFEHNSGKFKLQILTNAGAAVSAPHIEHLAKDVSMEGIYSAVRVVHTDDQPLNRVSPTYAWHQAANGSGTSPTVWRRVMRNGAGWEHGVNGVDNTTDTAEGIFGIDMICDGKLESKLGGEFNHDPGGDFDFGHFWFGAGVVPPPINLEKTIIRFNTYREIDSDQQHRNANNMYFLKLQGCDDYNVSTHTGTWVDLGFEIEGTPEKMGQSKKAECSVFAQKIVNAVRIVFVYMCGIDTGNPMHQGYIHTFEIQGSTTKYVRVQTTDVSTDIGSIEKVYAPASHEKLRGGVKSSGSAGCPRVLHHSVGASSEGAAYSLARALLKTKLRHHQMRHYEYLGLLPSHPELGITIQVDEDNDDVYEYTGVIHGCSVAVGADGVLTRCRVLDHSSAVIE